MNKKTIKWILVVVWMIVIFLFSNVGGTKSNDQSVKIVKDTIEQVNKITNKDMNNEDVNKLANKINIPFRKIIHVSEYFILTILLISALKESNVNGIKLYLISFIISFIYSSSDEIHQLLVGRTGMFLDVLIDCIGIILAIIANIIYNKIRLNKGC